MNYIQIRKIIVTYFKIIKRLNVLNSCKEKTSILLRDCKKIPPVLKISKN